MTLRRIIMLAAGPLAWRSLSVVAGATAAAALLTTPLRLPLSGPIGAASPSAPRRADAPPRQAMLYPAIAEHPLFSPTREPYVPPKAPASATVAEQLALHDYLLLGTVVEGVTSVAILKPPGSREAIRAVPGQTIAGWKLRRISPDALQFENGAARFALHFPSPRWPHP